jgi:hypothetical protein
MFTRLIEKENLPLGAVGLIEVTGVFSRNPCYHVGVLKEGR